MGALDDLVHAGKVRFVGLSNFKLDEIEACMAVRPRRRRAVRQEHVRPADGARDPALVRGATASGFLGYGALAYGLLTGTLPADHAFPADDWRLEDRQVGRDVAAVRAPLRPRPDRPRTSPWSTS